MLVENRRDVILGGVGSANPAPLLLGIRHARLHSGSDDMKGFGVSGSDPFALVDVEDIVVAQEGDFLLFASLFIFLFDPLPEDNHLRLDYDTKLQLMRDAEANKLTLSTLLRRLINLYLTDESVRQKVQ